MLGCLFLAALAVFVSWSYLTSSRLSKISDSNFYALPDLPAETQPPEQAVNSPLAGMFESFALLGNKIASVNLGKSVETSVEFFASVPGTIMKQLNAAADWTAEKLR